MTNQASILERATVTISPWGNSDAVRIPKHMLKLAGFKRGDSVSIEFDSSGCLKILPMPTEHRQVAPARGVTFEALFHEYEGPCEASSDPFPDEYEGTEVEAWSA